MRTLIVGGGPGGLFLAVLLKQARPDDEVVVFERNRPDDTFGFGVVFSDRTMAELAAYDRGFADALGAHAPRWTDIEVRHPRGTIRSGGHGFTSVARKRLLELLQARARAAGVDMRFSTEVSGPDDLPGHDLLVAADGVNSTVRGWHADAFGPVIDVGAAYFMWCGSTMRYDCLTFLFADEPEGTLGVHAYPYDAHTSTFLVETDEASWRAFGLDRHAAEQHPPGWNDEHSIERVARVFAGDLDGGVLLGNNSRWLRFGTVRNARWHEGNVVLLGDAAHTAHFSVGSGTRMAMQDAGELAGAVLATDRLDAALRRYEERRRPAVEAIQHASQPSLSWWERFGTLLRQQDPPQFVFNFLTRAPRLTRDVLKRRDRSVVEQVDEWWARRHGIDGGSDSVGLEAPLALRDVTLPNRVAVERRGAVGGRVGARVAAGSAELVDLAGPAVAGAGLVLTGTLGPAGADPAALATWADVVAAVHERSAARVGLQLPADCASADVVQAAAEAGFDLLELGAGPALGDAAAVTLAAAARAAWPDDRPLGVRLAVAPDATAVDACVALGARLRDAGCDLVAAAPATPEAAGGWRHLLAAERLRSDAGVVSMLVDGTPHLDAANTAVLAGRADLCSGSPVLGSARWRA